MKGDYEYTEVLFIHSEDNDFRMDQILSYLETVVPDVTRHPYRVDTWVLPVSKESIEYIEDYFRSMRDGSPRKSLPGVPVLYLSTGLISVSAGYDDDDNDRMREILNWISSHWNVRVNNEEREPLQSDFTRFPNMRKC